MKARPVFLLIVTLIIGFLLGMLTSAQLRHRKMRSVRMFSSERYFKEFFYKTIEPTEDQVNKLDPIIKKYSREGRLLQKDFRKEFDEHNNAYWNEIRSILTPAQLEILDKQEEKRRKEFRNFRPDSSGRGERGRHFRPDSLFEGVDSGRFDPNHPPRREYDR